MKKLDRALKQVFREKAVIRQAAKNVASEPASATVHSPTTDAGQPVERQIRKQWSPKKGGLPTFFRRAPV